LAWARRYILLLTAFYVDNGAHLPLWRELPTLAYWLLPAAIGLPLIMVTLRRHPLARAERQRAHTGAVALPANAADKRRRRR
jgi:hypothetical protein